MLMQKSYKIIILIAMVILAMIWYLYSVRLTKPVLYRYIQQGNPIREPSFSLFNPFRDKIPENVAEKFLEMLKAGKCQQAMSNLPVTEAYRKDICDRENEFALQHWRLKNRSDEPEKIVTYYEVHRTTESDRYQGAAWLKLEKRDTDWVVAGYECYY